MYVDIFAIQDIEGETEYPFKRCQKDICLAKEILGETADLYYRYLTENNGGSWHCHAVSKDTGEDKGSGVVRQASYSCRPLM